jgi:hypothetical protein
MYLIYPVKIIREHNKKFDDNLLLLLLLFKKVR